MGSISRKADAQLHMRRKTAQVEACGAFVLMRRRSFLAAPALGLPGAARAQALAWTTLSPGLSHTRFQAAASIGDRWLHALRIDPARFRFRLITGAVTGDAARTARQWARDHGLVAATNAGMFHPDGLPVGFAKADGRVIQTNLTRDRSVFVFSNEGARLLDREEEAFAPADHANALQSIRMISFARRNVWAQQPRIWSTACLAQDVEGQILFVHLRSPLSVHDFIAVLLASPLQVERAMYLEGGPEATLYARGDDGGEIERFGSYETGFNENDDNAQAWRLPNVLGVAPR